MACLAGYRCTVTQVQQGLQIIVAHGYALGPFQISSKRRIVSAQHSVACYIAGMKLIKDLTFTISRLAGNRPVEVDRLFVVWCRHGDHIRIAFLSVRNIMFSIKVFYNFLEVVIAFVV
ncbi:photosystem I reaction center subunit XI [Niastella sp. GCM10012298]|uniref:photosystem I reaction center subunit XI n=1 Tax=Niastella TaxID=354354 RepID=UPI00361004C8